MNLRANLVRYLAALVGFMVLAWLEFVATGGDPYAGDQGFASLGFFVDGIVIGLFYSIVLIPLAFLPLLALATVVATRGSPALARQALIVLAAVPTLLAFVAKPSLFTAGLVPLAVALALSLKLPDPQRQ